MALALADARAADGLRDLGRALDEAGRNLCTSLKLQCGGNAARDGGVTQRKSAGPAAPARDTAAKRVTPPLPRPKPRDFGGSSAAVVKPPSLAPVPRPKPAVIALLPPKPGKVVAPSSPQSGLGERCLDALAARRVEYEMVAMPTAIGACLVTNPVRVSAVATSRGRIVLSDRPVLSCGFARQFESWLANAGAGIVAERMNSPLAKVATGPGYECRNRNGDPSAKLSEHAFGNAVDITTLTTADGRRIAVADALNPASPSHAVLQGLRTGACGYFTTVLGPGANAAHASHFHFDMGRHGKSDTYRICQ